MSPTLLLCGDVMLGRGVDQVLPHPGNPQLRESFVRDAREYVSLAAERNGAVPSPVEFNYVWGNALNEFERVRPDFRIVNLETSITSSNSFWPHKDIHYRMHPANVPALQAAKIDCAVLANNHVLDFGYEGLSETLAALSVSGVKSAGAGQNRERAAAPAVLGAGESRVLVYACAHSSSGASAEWAADKDRPGINFLPDLSRDTVSRIKGDLAASKKPGDKVILSIHWGGNWGYEIDESQRQFAHALIDEAAVDVVHGHSSHHVKAIEIYRRKPILFGCGDFIDDYEGISGYESFRSDLKLMYFLALNATDGTLLSFQLVPMQMKRFRLQYAEPRDAQWLCDLLNRNHQKFGARFELTYEYRIRLVS